MQRICVFCGSNPGTNMHYQLMAESLGKAIAKRDWTLVYGGATSGLMGRLADAALAAGGQVYGVMPKILQQKECLHPMLTKHFIVDTLHERKQKMAELSDAFIMLPGGAGTMEEFFEIWSWKQLGIHRKPCGILNTEGYFDPLLELLKHMVSQGFLASESLDMLTIETEPDSLLTQLKAEAKHFNPPETNADYHH